MYEELGKFLREQLYPDLKTWIASLAQAMVVPVKKATSTTYDSPAALSQALRSNKLRPDSWVTLRCKPSTFGPFLRSHMLSPIVGSCTDMRLGPPLQAENQIMAMMAQTTSHLKPVGLYPPIDTQLSQICLYPEDSEVCGMIGILPGINSLVEHVPAVCNVEKLPQCGAPSKVQGILRCVSPTMLQTVGIPIERWEELRQAGAIWYIDLFSDGTEIATKDHEGAGEMWGALYASGHMEFDGELKIQPLVDGMASCFDQIGVQPYVTQNRVNRKEIMVYGKGIRSRIDTTAPIYSIHMDAQISSEYQSYRERFDRVCVEFQKNHRGISDIIFSRAKKPERSRFYLHKFYVQLSRAALWSGGSHSRSDRFGR